ncbi:MAG: hypothetical protein ABI847_13220, partial [Anaerolineales bacterium]
MNHKLSLMRLLGIAAAACLVVSACGPAATAVPPSPAPTTAPTAVPPSAVPTTAPTTAPTAAPAAATATTAPTVVPSTATAAPASLQQLRDVAFDANGKLYVSDCGSNGARIFAVDSSGV